MSNPSYGQLLLPILKIMGDSKERRIPEIFDSLDKELQFSEEDKAQKIASGGNELKNRISWSLSSLKNANLLENTARGCYKITKQGQEVLKENPSTISQETLLRYAPTDSKFFYPQKKDKEGDDSEQDLNEDLELSQTPLELMEENYQLLKDNLSNELLQIIKKKDPYFFESLVVELLLAMGYGDYQKDAGATTDKSHDGGIDGTIKQDKLGLDIIYLQAKRYDSNSIGAPDIQKFVGALDGKKAQKGIFITTTHYSKEARECERDSSKRVILIDGNKLVDLMIENNVGVSKDITFEIKKIDLDYFE